MIKKKKKNNTFITLILELSYIDKAECTCSKNNVSEASLLYSFRVYARLLLLQGPLVHPVTVNTQISLV